MMPAPLTLVLLPGLDGTGLLFTPLVAALPTSLRPIVLPYPVDRVMSYEELATAIEPQLPSDQPFVLLGESFGGPLAIMLAARRPAGLVGLVLCASFATSPRPALGPLLRPLANPWVFRLYPYYKRAGLRFSRRPAQGSWAAAAEAVEQVRPEVIASRVRTVLSVDVREALRECPVPILYLQGAHDRVVTAANLRRILAVQPAVSVVTIETTHQILQRQPAECATAISRFVNEVGS